MKEPVRSWETWAACFATGCAWAGLAAFLGEVRAPLALLAGIMLLCLICAVWSGTRRALLVISVLGGALLLTVLLFPVLRPALRQLERREAPQAADAIVVLGGGLSCGSAQLEASSAARLTRGLELWRAGYAPVLTLSEQAQIYGNSACPKVSALSRGQIERLYGQDGPRTLILRQVTDTHDEAVRVRELARLHGWQRVLLVTSPSHSRRAAALFDREGLQVVSVPAEEPRFDGTLPLASDRLYALRVVTYEVLSRVKAVLSGSERM
ncbi:YdcF family protein [Deinococcus peraridilitoris]|uniref:DUF218 domain-containing protein n=1 Tax=Deinococcus peraridilitoris (strain DSM 19664 / LMG 22246 / CIP 109416 / KR-200) TaxID=937777 RepID=L0A3H4_DEIPD|nr:YdcF family protein [Deinococcus peraridilitoris]AFZ68396.1 hypothetical protein Deipe_2940 [Deinococcus peraridilitoris DSM 19664]